MRRVSEGRVAAGVALLSGSTSETRENFLETKNRCSTLIILFSYHYFEAIFALLSCGIAFSLLPLVQIFAQHWSGKFAEMFYWLWNKGTFSKIQVVLQLGLHHVPNVARFYCSCVVSKAHQPVCCQAHSLESSFSDGSLPTVQQIPDQCTEPRKMTPAIISTLSLCFLLPFHAFIFFTFSAIFFGMIDLVAILEK